MYVFVEDFSPYSGHVVSWVTYPTPASVLKYKWKKKKPKLHILNVFNLRSLDTCKPSWHLHRYQDHKHIHHVSTFPCIPFLVWCVCVWRTFNMKCTLITIFLGAQKAAWFHVHEVSKIAKFIEVKNSRRVVARRGGLRGMGRFCPVGTKFQSYKMGKF